MKVGLIDVDGKGFPNIPLMKLSAFHKRQGDQVSWYEAIEDKEYDIVYMSKVFSFTPDYQYPIKAKKVIKGGSGYCISLVDGKEVFDKSKDIDLPYEIEHIYPDYSIYYDRIPKVRDTAYGFLSRGCPRGCHFCHVATKEGRCSYKVADLSEFWDGQKNLVLCDPNITACNEWRDLFQQIIDSKANVDFNQGLDIRMMTREKAEMIKQMKIERIHFAWDRYEDKEVILPKLKDFKDVYKVKKERVTCYVLVNYDSTFDQDKERVYTLRDMGYSPYVMIYNKEHLPKGHYLTRFQRYVNSRFIFNKIHTFEEYTRKHSNKIEQISLFELGGVR